MKLWLWSYAALMQFKKGRSLARRALRKLSGRQHGTHDVRMPAQIPRKIWMFWDKGEDAAPPLIKACIDSWRAQNPGWDLTVLDNTSLEGVVDMPRPQGNMTVQAYSDMLRLRLLRRYGGVWIDATVFCLKPLDQWLPVMARDGFFALLWTEADKGFVLPNVHRLMNSWFLASEPDGEIVTAWDERTAEYWAGRDTPHDYYWVHVLMEHMLLTDRKFRLRFEAMPKMGAYPAHLVHDYVRLHKNRDQIRAALASGAVPLQKLRWNWTPEQMMRVNEVMDGLPRAEAPEAVPATGKNHV